MRVPRYVLKLSVELWALSAPIYEENERMLIHYVISNLEFEACLVEEELFKITYTVRPGATT